MDAPDYRPADPLRPVDWRFRVATYRTDHGLQLSPRDHEAATCACGRYLRSQRADRSSSERCRSARQQPDIHAAFQLYQSQEVLKFAVEARLLSGAAIDAIASLIGVPPAVVELYSQLFFDVRDRLGHRDYIFQCVINASQRAGDWRDSGWKLVAYLGDDELMDQVIGSTIGLDGLLEGLAQQKRIVLARQTAAAIHKLGGANDRTLVGLVQSSLSKQPETDGPQSTIMRNLKVLLSKVPWTMDAPTGPTAKIIADFEKGGRVLRAHELARIGAGLPVELGPLPSFPEAEAKAEPEAKAEAEPTS